MYPNADLYEQVIKVTSCDMKLTSDHNSLSPSRLAMWRKTSADNCLMRKEEKANKKEIRVGDQAAGVYLYHDLTHVNRTKHL